jgi:hypothetical protein
MLSILCPCLVDLSIPASKTGAFQMGLRTQYGDFVKDDSDYVSVIYGNRNLEENCVDGTINITCTRGPNEKCQFSQNWLYV